MWLAPAELYQMGFGQVVFPAVLMMRVVETLDLALRDLKNFADGRAAMPPYAGYANARAEFDQAVMLDRWTEIRSPS